MFFFAVHHQLLHDYNCSSHVKFAVNSSCSALVNAVQFDVSWELLHEFYVESICCIMYHMCCSRSTS